MIFSMVVMPTYNYIYSSIVDDDDSIDDIIFLISSSKYFCCCCIELQLIFNSNKFLLDSFGIPL